MYADFGELTLRVTLEALFGFESGSTSTTSSNADASEQIVAAVARAFEFFTRRAGSAFVLPEWVPTLDNLEFASAVQQLDTVR